MLTNIHRKNHRGRPFLSAQAIIFLSLFLGVTLGSAGCASLGRLIRPTIPLGDEADTSQSRAYYHYLKAQRLLLADDAPGAAQEYEEALRHDPEAARLETELATLYQRLGEVKKALAHVENAIKLDPKQPEAYFLLAGLHVGLNQLEEATSEYEQLLVLDPDNREARLFLATLYAQQRRFPKAIRTIQELLRQEPNSVAFQPSD